VRANIHASIISTRTSSEFPLRCAEI
jgi:hypothetical protein